MTPKKNNSVYMGVFQLQQNTDATIDDMIDELSIYLSSLQKILAGTQDDSVDAESLYSLLEPAVAMVKILRCSSSQKQL